MARRFLGGQGGFHFFQFLMLPLYFMHHKDPIYQISSKLDEKQRFGQGGLMPRGWGG